MLLHHQLDPSEVIRFIFPSLEDFGQYNSDWGVCQSYFFLNQLKVIYRDAQIGIDLSTS